MTAFYRYTLIFLLRGEEILMIHRRNPPNQGMWNGVGGRLEPGELPLQGALREVREETGYSLPTAHFAGLLTWDGHSETAGGLYIFTAQVPNGAPSQPLDDEGELAWQPRELGVEFSGGGREHPSFWPLRSQRRAAPGLSLHSTASATKSWDWEIRPLPPDHGDLSAKPAHNKGLNGAAYKL